MTSMQILLLALACTSFFAAGESCGTGRSIMRVRAADDRASVAMQAVADSTEAVKAARAQLEADIITMKRFGLELARCAEK